MLSAEEPAWEASCWLPALQDAEPQAVPNAQGCGKRPRVTEGWVPFSEHPCHHPRGPDNPITGWQAVGTNLLVKTSQNAFKNTNILKVVSAGFCQFSQNVGTQSGKKAEYTVVPALGYQFVSWNQALVSVGVKKTEDKA